MRNERPSFMEMLWCLALTVRRAMIMAILTVPVGLAAAGLLIMWGMWGVHQAWASAPALDYLTSLTAAVALWLLNWGGRIVATVVPPTRRTQRMHGTEQAEAGGYNGWNTPLVVTLTATDNQYLQPDLPLRGLLMVHEMRTDDFAMPLSVTFQRLSGGDLPMNAPVHVDYAEFTYAPPRRTA